MILEVQNGCFGYPKQPVILENINLSLEEGHILAILGPNGIGKTTLLKCMIGLLPWHSGKTLLYGKDIHTLKPKDVWSTISYIPQSRGFAFSYTGLEMVLLGRSAHLGAFQQPGKEEIEMAEAMMERVGITRLANKDCNRLGVDGQEVSVKPGEVLYVPPKTLCGTKTDSGMIYTEIILKKENFTMNNIIKAGQPTELKNLISYEEGSIANLDIAHADNMKFVLMAFDEGTGLTPHRAPGNAILTALEGKAIIGYEGKDYELNAGESFRFDKNGLHSVTAQGKFKMSLLLVIE